MDLRTKFVFLTCIVLVLLSGFTWGLQKINDPILAIKNLVQHVPTVYAQYESGYSGGEDTSDYYGSDEDTSDYYGSDEDTSDYYGSDEDTSDYEEPDYVPDSSGNYEHEPDYVPDSSGNYEPDYVPDPPGSYEPDYVPDPPGSDEDTSDYPSGTGTAPTEIPTGSNTSLPDSTETTFGVEILDPVPEGPCRDTSTSDVAPVECDEPPLPQKCSTNDNGLTVCSSSQAQRAIFYHLHTKPCFTSYSHPDCPSDSKKKGSGNHVHVIHYKPIYNKR